MSGVRRFLKVCLVILAAVLPGHASGAFSLTGAQETPPVATNARGLARVTYDLGTRLLSWHITFSGLADVTGAHFHTAPPGTPGGVTVDIGAISGLSSPMIGSTTLSPGQGADLLAGNFYINIHSTAHSAGEIRGQVRLTDAVGDFNADGRSDILWRKASGPEAGPNAIWQMNGLNVDASSLIPPVADADWRVAAAGDFNGDGRADILWRKTSNPDIGSNAIWQMDGFDLSASALIPRVADRAWNIFGVGDFNGDGKADILWRNTTSSGPDRGTNAIWQMDGFDLMASALIPTVADTAWMIVGVGDFNGDGKADILWRNIFNGDNAIWQMDGFTVMASALLPRVSGGGWFIVGVGDFNGDGRADILWRSFASGDNAIWLMDGFTVVSAALINSVAGSLWGVVGVGDYNWDGRADILWRNSSSGENAIWLMNGVAVTAAALIRDVPDRTWEVVGRPQIVSAVGTSAVP